MHLFKYVLLLVLFAVLSCKESYDIPIAAARTNTLVVEGVINSSGATNIKLSRSAALPDTSSIHIETGASVSVESEGGAFTVLPEITPGTYEDSTSADPSQKYRLHIRTSDGREYASDFVPVIIGPMIDSISWKRKDDNVAIFANTHDESNSTRYYRWNYKETWEFHSAFISNWEYVNQKIIYRVNNNIFTCFQSNESSAIIHASSAKLVTDIISEAPITTVSNGSEKISVLYSILVNQYPLTKDAYEYWEQLKKNTEKLGTIFDPQPSANKTNIYCLSDPTEMVIGYISAGNIVSERLFIYNQEVQPWSYGTGCIEALVPNDSFEYYFGSNFYIPTTPGNGAPPNTGFYGSVPPCVDCTLKGTNVKPSFWPR
ncbi:MAG TPA: DUF4249 domain-containing protein [Flavitalea sp.]|nr:DUF4249 domain-containing protein [Flavitalea sp.]